VKPWLPTLLALALLTAPAHADEPAEDTDGLPFGASVMAEVSVGAGSFTPGPAARPYVNLLMDFDADYTFEPLGLVVGLGFSFHVNAVENADSGNTVPNQVRPGDVSLGARLPDLLAWKAIGLGITPRVALVLPTSLESQYVGKYLGMKAGVGVTYEPIDWLAVDARASVTKNLNAYTTAVLAAEDFDRPPLSRAGGAEAVGATRIATGGGVTSWYTTWGLGATFTALEVLSFLIDFEMLHSFGYQTIPLDAYSSPYAQAGRGQSDLMYGTLEVSWEALEYLTVALGTLVEQAPLSDDNTRARFPFWDTSNGSENRQVFYLDVTGSI